MIDVHINSNAKKQIKIFSDLSIVIVTYDRLTYLQDLLLSLEEAIRHVDKRTISLMIGVNGPHSATENFLSEFAKQHTTVTLDYMTLPERLTPAEARNIVVSQVNSDWILFLDDDVLLPQYFFKNFFKLQSEYPEPIMWGGPNLTPVRSDQTQKKIGQLLESFLVVGPVALRYRFNQTQMKKGSELYFSLCNLFIKKNYFEENQFNKNLKTAEENQLIYSLKKMKYPLATSDLLYVWHHRRGSFVGFLSQIKNYGYGRGQLIYYGGMSRWISFFSLALVFLVGVGLYKRPIYMINGFILWFFLFISSFYKKNNWRDRSIYFLPFQIWYHYFYGILSGYLSTLKTSLSSKYPSS